MAEVSWFTSALVGDRCRPILVGHRNLGNTGYGLQACLDDGGACRAVHVFYCESDGSVRGHRRRGRDNDGDKSGIATSLFMLALRSRGKKEGSDGVEAKRGGDEDRCQDEGCLDDAIWQGPRARFTLGAAARPRSVSQPIARSQ